LHIRRTLCAVLLLVGAEWRPDAVADAAPLSSAGKSVRAAPRRSSKRAPAPVDPARVNDPSTKEPVREGSRGAAVLRAQILLARAHFSSGEIDGKSGSNLRKAISAFQKARELSVTGTVDAATWQTLSADSAPALVNAVITPEDVAGPFIEIPDDIAEKSKLPALSYTSPLEGLGEKYRSSPALLAQLNPGVAFDRAGVTILAPNTVFPPPGPAARVVVSKTDTSVTALDSAGKVLSYYPATIGSEHDPLPIGEWKILGVSRNPPFHYNPQLFWDARSEDKKSRIAPGPNNPVGVAWIDLSKPHYGIHGTSEPSRVGKSESHGCIRLTNWDVWELQQMVSPGIPATLEP
jgi:lipoprotein-anchoring transpeptidase ErfK/SrfK